VFERFVGSYRELVIRLSNRFILIRVLLLPLLILIYALTLLVILTVVLIVVLIVVPISAVSKAKPLNLLGSRR
ncbi:MAG TPA: hypothetical protein VNK81_05575, partial [Thermodesulfobacteriota bacterium]|nr:hypothetical protein [Thermodesulfobacteriota bacterium]